MRPTFLTAINKTSLRNLIRIAVLPLCLAMVLTINCRKKAEIEAIEKATVVIDSEGKFTGNLLISKKGIYFKNVSGDLNFIRSLKEKEQVAVSKNGAHTGIIIYEIEENLPIKAKLEVLDIQGKIKVKFFMPPLSEGVIISNDGKLIINVGSLPARSFFNDYLDLIFYDEAGKLLMAHRDREFKLHSVFDLSAETNYLVVVALAHKDRACYLFLMDNFGQEVWRRKLSEREQPVDVAISANGDMIAVCTNSIAPSRVVPTHAPREFVDNKGSFYLYDGDGNQIKAHDLDVLGPKHVVLSPDGTYSAVIDRDSLNFFECESGEKLWEKTLDQKDYWYRSVSVSKEGSFVVVGSTNHLVAEANRLVNVYDKDGELVKTSEFNYKQFVSDFGPEVKITPDGGTISVVTKRDTITINNK